MSKEELLEFTGEVIEKLPNAMFRVKLENGVEILAHTAGKMRKFRIRVMVGDKVDIEMTPYDLTKGRITFRHKDYTLPVACSKQEQATVFLLRLNAISLTD